MNIELKRLLLEIVLFFLFDFGVRFLFHVRLSIYAQTLLILIIIALVRKVKFK